MRAQLSTHDYEQLSAYLDGQLAPGERNRLEAHLKTRPELQTALEDLRQTRALLRMAPRKRAPRNFTLTPAMVGDMPPARKVSRGWGGFNLFPALSFASAMAALLLIAVIFFDLGTQRASTAMQPASGAAVIPEARTMMTQGAGAPAAPAAVGQSAPGATANDSAPASNPAPEAAAGAAAKAAPSDNGGIPGGPMNWYGATGRGGAGGGGMVAGSDPSAAIIAQYGVGGAGDGSLSVPPQVLGSPPSAQSQLSAEQAPQAAQPNPQISGSGPIVGVAAADQAGKVIEQQSSMGHPELVTPVAPSSAAPAAVPAAAPASEQASPSAPDQYAAEPWYARNVAGLPALRLIEGGLLAVALAAGLAAFILWRRRL